MTSVNPDGILYIEIRKEREEVKKNLKRLVISVDKLKVTCYTKYIVRVREQKKTKGDDKNG